VFNTTHVATSYSFVGLIALHVFAVVRHAFRREWTPDQLGLSARRKVAQQGDFSDLSASHRSQAVRKSLGYLQKGGDAEALIATARHYLVYNADEAHDYKFSEAVFDSYSHLSDSAWRCRFLSAGMAYFKAPGKRPGPVIEETLELLHA
jgi:hypothetical protein